MAFGGRNLRIVVSALATMALVGGSLALGPTAAAQADDPLPSPPPLLQRDEKVVTSDPLPTVQIDSGYVWSQAVIGTTVYAVGQFDNARPAKTPPGTALEPRSNILAFDINSGELLPFAPTVNGAVKAVAASPDGSRVYIGGSFSNVNGQTRWNIAALNAQTGELVPGFTPYIGGSGVYALTADSDTLYAGGLFTQANGTARQNLAAFATSNGALRLDWDSQPDQQIDAMILDPDGEHVVAGGRFSSVDGNGAWRGMVSIASGTGEIDQAWQGTQKVKNGWGSGSNRGKAGIFALNNDDGAIYGTGWVYANAQVGNLEGVFALESASGDTRWVADCLGDHYGVYSTGDVVYSTSHTHACSTMNLWPEQSPREHKFVQAMTTDVQGTLPRQPHTGTTYANWEGENAPAAYAWYPDFFTGTATGLSQAGLSITGAGNTISVAGEFPGVNNDYFQGIVRFSTAPPDGANDGPRTTTAEWGTPTASTLIPGRIRVSINGTWDRDDRDLTYTLLRDDTDDVIDSITHSNGWWDVPSVSLVDSSVEAGQNYTYRVRVADGDGNTVVSQPVTSTASTEAALAYTSAVSNDGASLYYPLGNSTADWAGANPAIFGNGVTQKQPSAVLESGTGYSTFSGSSTGRVSTSARATVPTQFSTELWFNTTTTRGGKLIGYGNSQTGTSSTYDRHIYMLNNGRLAFGVGNNKAVTSSTGYNDGQWHHAVATLSGEGMKLYVDGTLVGSDATTTTGQAFSGYWRIGGDNLSSWPNKPSSNWFAGSIDEVAVYPHALTESQIANHYAIGTGYEAPTAAFGFTSDELTVDVDGSGSTVATGGSLVDFSWDFGDGSEVVSGPSATTAHTYEQTGTYDLTLTVRDNRGFTSTITQPVSVLGPNALPSASFTTQSQGLTLTVDGTDSTDPDGTIETFEWDWGDDSEPGTGAVASHSYAAAGTYSVTLTIIDDRGGSASTTHEVEVTHAPPTATFEAATSGLTVETDASGSASSDGATLSYSWQWGDDSGESTGEQASHSYAADGSYEITLTVTDSLGASTSSTRAISVQATRYAAFDDFDRVVSNGWGEALTGGLWTTKHGSASVASTDGTHGLLDLSPSFTRQMALQDLSVQDLESELVYSMEYGPSNGTSYVGMTLRQSETSGYTLHAWHRNNGTVWLVAEQGSTVIGAQQVPGLGWTEGDEFTIKTQVTGTDPTTIQAKIWLRDTAEPEAWQLSVSDSEPALQQAGFASVRYYLSGSAAGAGLVAFDRVSILDLNAESDPNVPPEQPDPEQPDPEQPDPEQPDPEQPDPEQPDPEQPDPEQPAENQPPVADFTSSLSDLTVSVDATASTDTDGTIDAYEWDWGDDSATATGVTASHSYAAAGTYTITLTVTDDLGASHSTTKQITISDQEPTVGEYIISDDFERSTTASWGSADVGGAWTISGGSAVASVAEGEGRLNLPPGETRIMLLPDSPIREYFLGVDFSIDTAPDSGGTYVGAIARDTGAGSYIVHAWLRTDGTVWLVAQRDSQVLEFQILSGLTYEARDSFSLKLEVTGTESTQLRAKLWKSDDTEPIDWQLTTQDDTPALQSAGSIGLRAYRGGAATSPSLIAFDRFYVAEVE